MNKLRALLMFALSLGMSAAYAQEESATWYEVELIVFQQWEAGGEHTEQRIKDAPALDLANAVRLVEPAADGSLTPYALIPADKLRLGGVMQVLEKSQGYQPLLHLGWRQPGLGQKQAQAVMVPPEWLPDGPTPPLYGLVRLIRERYLHVAVDLRYLPEGEAATESVEGESLELNADGGESDALQAGSELAIEAAAPAGDSAGTAVSAETIEAATGLQPSLPVHMHRQTRRMRSGELHYLDHPVLGVLVQVTPVEQPAAAQ